MSIIKELNNKYKVKQLAKKYHVKASPQQEDCQKLLDAGGKDWKKNVGSKELHRIYLNQDAVIKFLNLDQKKLSDFDLKSLKKAKTYYDVDAGKFISDVGTVRTLFNQKRVKCTASDEPFFGTVETTNWAINIEGIDNAFPKKTSFGDQLLDSSLKKFRDFTKSAKCKQINTKGSSSLASIKREVLFQEYDQFAARWSSDASGTKSDVINVYYK